MFLSRLIWMGSAAACALVVSSASAQPGAQPADEPATAQDESDQPTASNDANEIVVTALRRSQRLQSVPASITAIGGDTLASNHVSSAAELSANVPNLQATSTLGENIPIFSLRGVSMSDFSVNQQSPVATYFDEVYKGSFPFIPIGLYDLERLEVLRGPQGTLYGKNTTGGAVVITAPDPAGGRDFRVKDIGGAASTNSISIAAFAGETIEGVAGPRVLSTDLGEWVFESDGTNWWIG